MDNIDHTALNLANMVWAIVNNQGSVTQRKAQIQELLAGFLRRRAKLGAVGKYTRQDLQRWRNDALEAAAQICDRYGLDAYGAGHDIRVMKHKEISDAPYNPNDRAALTASGGRDLLALERFADWLQHDLTQDGIFVSFRPLLERYLRTSKKHIAEAQPAQEKPE